MRFSQLFAPTLREDPAEAEVVSHRLLVRAGFIRKLAAGVYTYLPLAQRVLEKIKQIIREEMDREGGQELTMPILQPAELWLESGRWHVYGEELFRLKDRHGRDFALGPTHEEIVTDLVRREVKSYRQLPLLLYQIANKYRDERRPRFGLMRGREFIMKDLYSFDRDEEGLDESYRRMFRAYTRIFRRMGLNFRPVEADTGAIGGNVSHEFMVIASSGEAAIVYCDSCDYAANVEKAETVPRPLPGEEEPLPVEEVATPGCKTIAEVADYLKIEPARLIKAVVYQAFYRDREELVLVLVRGDREVNEVKVHNLLGCLQLNMAGEQEIQKVCGAPVGYIGPVGLQGIKILADQEVPLIKNAVCGANREGYHLRNVNYGRDFTAYQVADLRMVEAGEQCLRCGGKLLSARGIEVGQIFKLGTKYSEALGATFLDEKGQERPMVMGCYGIGVTRTMAAAVEQNHDENGIIWPIPIAPYHVIVVPVNMRDEEQVRAAEEIYSSLLEAGIEVVIDDRDERPGVKFKDADLIGFPIRVVVGKSLSEGKVEVKIRRTGDSFLLDRNEVVGYIKDYIAKEIARTVEEC